MLTKLCLHCQSIIYKPINESLRAWEFRRKYCSRSCGAIYRKLGELGKDNHYKNGHTPKNPIKKGQRLSALTEFKKGQTLSSNWYDKMIGHIPWNKGKRFTQITGEKHFAWKGGKSTLNVKIRNLPETKNWRQEIFKRDNFTCVLCGHKSSDRKPNYVPLNADHYPKTFASIIDNYEIKSVEEAVSCTELWDLNNGRTLCLNCHRKTDTWGRNRKV